MSFSRYGLSCVWLMLDFPLHPADGWMEVRPKAGWAGCSGVLNTIGIYLKPRLLS